MKIETAPNLNKTKIQTSAFLLNSRHFEFEISSTQCKFLDFLKNISFIENDFSNDFFCKWEASASALARARQDPHPDSQKKVFLQKVKKITLGRADFGFKMSRIQQKSRNVNFGFVQIVSSFKCEVKIVRRLRPRQRSGVASQQRLRPRRFDSTVKRVPKLRFEPVSFPFLACL